MRLGPWAEALLCDVGSLWGQYFKPEKAECRIWAGKPVRLGHICAWGRAHDISFGC